MIIVSGKKTRRRSVGMTADFCPICRDLTRHWVTELATATHLYFVPVGGYTPQHYEMRCERCQCLSGAELSVCVPIAIEDGLDVTEIAERSREDDLGDLVERMEIEDRFARGEASPEERMQLIAEPLVHMEYTARQLLKSGGHTSVTTIVIFLFLIGLVASAIMLFMVFDRVATSRAFVGATVGVCIATLLLGWWTVVRIRRTNRYVVRSGRVWGQLVRSLRLLNPTRDELRRVIDELRRLRLTVAKGADAAELHEAIGGL